MGRNSSNVKADIKQETKQGLKLQRLAAWKVRSRLGGNHYCSRHLGGQPIYNTMFKYWILDPWHISFTLTCCPLGWLSCHCAATKDFHSCLFFPETPGVPEDLNALHPLVYTRWSWNGLFNARHLVPSKGQFGWFCPVPFPI